MEKKKYIGNKEKLRRANQKIVHLKREIKEKELYEYKYKELRKQWNRLVDTLLGTDYYNYGCDTYSCDKFTVDDLIYKYKKKVVAILEENIKIIENLINQNKSVIKEAKKSNDINSMNLIADMDNQNKALNQLPQAYKEDEAVIKEMVEHIASSAIVDDMVCMYKDCNNEDCHNDTARECTEQYFRKKVKDENTNT